MRHFIVAILLLILPATVHAEAFDHEAAVKSGNTAYNGGDYASALRWYTQAIQADSNQATTYRNLARTYFWQDQYAAATSFYDHYLRLAPADALDLEQVKAERKLASTRAGEDVWTIPDNQRLARQALDSELQTGKAFSEGGGGAWGLYETLIRTGYVQPDLAQLKSTLTRRVLDEFEGLLQPQGNDLVPQLSIEAWQMQSQRLAAARAVVLDPTVTAMIDRRSTVVEAGLALLGGRTAKAVDLAKLARKENPDLKWTPWYEIVALTRAGSHEAALETLESFSRQLRQENPAQLPYATTMKAIILQRLERWDDAAQTFQIVLN
jgi:tetratricopeptide (TPR) repeat protein